MLRRSLFRFLPIAPRDVDRPERYGKNDDTDQNRSRGSASGSRPTARAADPFLLPNPIPKEVFPLEKHHYLSLYDLFSTIDPSLEVKAFIADKSAYSYDMLVLTDRENGNPEYMEHLNFELRSKLAKIASTKTTKLKCLVEFFDKRELHVGFGVKGITPEMINKEPNWAQRELLRSSLNYDWTKWELSWSHWFREVVDHLGNWGEYAIDGPDLKVERHYWAAQAFWARKKIYTDGTELYHFVCDNHVLTLHEMLPHPILRFEDLHSCEIALKMKEMLKTPESIIQIKQDKTMLTQDEVEYLRQLDIQTEREYKERLAEKQREEDDIKSGKKKPGWLFY
jgi:hypothetical protein